MTDPIEYKHLALGELLEERHELKGKWVDIRYQLDESSAEYHEDGITGDKYVYAELKRDERALENDIELLDELIEQRKVERDSSKVDDLVGSLNKYRTDISTLQSE